MPAIPARCGITAPLRRRPGGTRHAQQRSAILGGACKGCHHRGLATWGITPFQNTRRAPSSPWSRNRPAGTVRDHPRVDVHVVHGPQRAQARARAVDGRQASTGYPQSRAGRVATGGTPTHPSSPCGRAFFHGMVDLVKPWAAPNARRHTQTRPGNPDIPRPCQPPTGAGFHAGQGRALIAGLDGRLLRDFLPVRPESQRLPKPDAR